jgi:AdoMet-dependent heme synthase
MRRMLSLLPAIVRNRRRQAQLPRFLTYIVTFSCNVRCVMCDSWRKPSPDDLALGEIERIFSQLPRMDVVRLSGGEPFVRQDLPAIARLVQQKLRPLFLHVTTNGFLTDRIVRFCEQRSKDVPLQLLVSVDGLEDKHNQVRGHRQAWSYAVRTLEALAPRRRELRLRLAVNQTIVDAEGVEHYRRLRDFLAPLGVRNNVVMAYDASATYHLDSETDVAPTEIGQFTTFGELGDHDLRDLFDEVERDLEHYPFAERLAKRYYLRGIRNRLLGSQGRPNPRCVALASHLRLLPNGQVPTCQFNTKTVGSLRHQSFEELWFGEPARGQRGWVHRCPGCWAECEVLPNAFYTGDLMLESLLPRRRSGRKRQADRRPPAPVPARKGLPVLPAAASGAETCS